jgi:hypothetical protein
MSGSRGEANFVWRCKNCKASFCFFSEIVLLIMVLTMQCSENHPQQSKLPLRPMRRPSQRSQSRSWFSTAEGSSLPSLSQKYAGTPTLHKDCD